MAFIVLAACSSLGAILSWFHFLLAKISKNVVEGRRQIHYILTFSYLCQNSCMCESYKHRLFCVSYPQLALQTPYNVLGFVVLTGSEQLRNDGNFLCLGLRNFD